MEDRTCHFLGAINEGESVIAYFRIGRKTYEYSLEKTYYDQHRRRSFDMVNTVSTMADHSCFKALNWCKRNGRLVNTTED